MRVLSVDQYRPGRLDCVCSGFGRDKVWAEGKGNGKAKGGCFQHGCRVLIWTAGDDVDMDSPDHPEHTNPRLNASRFSQSPRLCPRS